MTRKLGVQVQTTIETTKKMTCQVNGDNLLDLLSKSGVKIPPGATVMFVVPGGGDWSGQAIDVTDENPVLVEWSTHTVEGN